MQLLRDGFFMPAQTGMSLLPGDRLVSDPGAKALVRFTGVNDALVIENGAAATFNLEMVEFEQGPQWIATNLEGEGVYFDAQTSLAEDVATLETNKDETGNAGGANGMFGLFGAPVAEESTGYPILESVVFLGATAAIFSDNEDNPAMAGTTGPNENGDGGTTTPPGTTPEAGAEAGPLDALLGPLTSVLDGLTGNVGAASPLGSLTAPQEGSELLNALNMANLG